MELTLLLVGGGAVAGIFGALLGLGGGILIVPLLTLGFGVPFREAVAVSLLAVITTSSAGAAVYLRQGLADLRLGMTLELATAVGALVGGLAAFLVSERFLAAGFAAMLGYSAVAMVRASRKEALGERAIAARPVAPGADELPPARAHALAGSAAPETDRPKSDRPMSDRPKTDCPEEQSAPAHRSYRGLRWGLVLSGLAGVVSALLGVGGGVVKVPAMNVVMGVPLRVATATSNLMIGVTASASAVVYLLRGAVDPYVAGPVMVGVFMGATGASRLAHRVPVNVLRLLFVAVLAYVALQMAAVAAGVSLPGSRG